MVVISSWETYRKRDVYLFSPKVKKLKASDSHGKWFCSEILS